MAVSWQRRREETGDRRGRGRRGGEEERGERRKGVGEMEGHVLLEDGKGRKGMGVRAEVRRGEGGNGGRYRESKTSVLLRSFYLKKRGICRLWSRPYSSLHSHGRSAPVEHRHA